MNSRKVLIGLVSGTVLTTLALTGCSSQPTDVGTPEPTATTTEAPEPEIVQNQETERVTPGADSSTPPDDPYPGVDQAVIDRTFVEGAREVAGLWEYTDDQLVRVAHSVCRGFDNGGSLDE